MDQVPDGFLLQVAGIASTLLGFFVIGVFFYVQRGVFPQVSHIARSYMRAMTKAILVLYGMAVAVALALVVLPDARTRLLYAGVSILLVWSVVELSVATHRLHRAIRIRTTPQTAIWVPAAVILTLPWFLGGAEPTRPDLVWGVVLAGIFAFVSSASLVLSTFDIASMEASARSAAEERGEEAA